MPGVVADSPSVQASFANNFWGKDDAGVQPLLERMHNAKVTSDELKSFYNTRSAIEDEYARKLLALCRKPLGSLEAGTLRASLDVLRGEIESTGKAHQSIAAQMKSELEEPLGAFAGGMKERRKIIQAGIEKLLKTKVQQTQTVNKTRDRFEQDCLRIKGYLAQGHMVMGQEERKNKAKLEKTQIQMATTSNEYEAAIKALEETTGRWNKDWKAACDKFQDLEEERLDFTKSSLWEFANIASTVCVSDDSSCEKIRLSLENCEVERDISSFIKTRGTGQEIPDPPKYINFCRGDINESASEASEDESYSVAQFHRTINPAFRSSSPVPSTLESHHDPSNDLGLHRAAQKDQSTPRSRDTTITPQNLNSNPPAQPDFRRQAAQVQAAFQQHAPPDLSAVPHNEYPADGMTMFCRTDGQSERSSVNSPVRPSSRDSHSDYSNPTSMSSVDPVSGNVSPTKGFNGSDMQPTSPSKGVQKKRSGFFSNSPFRRKSKHEKDKPQIGSANTWAQSSGTKNQSPTKIGFQARDFAVENPDDLDPVDPRASFQLNVGQNVFDVASPDTPRGGRSSVQRGSSKIQAPTDNEDPIAAALAELKSVTKESASRVSADRYHGLATPVPGSQMQNQSNMAKRGTPPPGYNDRPLSSASGTPSGAVKRLDAPQAAHTSASMQAATRKYTSQTAEIYGSPTRGGAGPRSSSPLPLRGTSPRPLTGGGAPQQYRATSPNPQARGSTIGPGASPMPIRPAGANPHHQRRQTQPPPQQQPGGYYPSDNASSPQGQYTRRENPRPSSSQDSSRMALQLSGGGGGGPSDGGALGQGNRAMTRPSGRPVSFYGGAGGGGGLQGPGANAISLNGEDRRVRSRSIAAPPQQSQLQQGDVTMDGTPVLHYSRAMYSYSAAIPQELSFSKGDVLAILRHQDDGWWEAEVTGGRLTGRGLVPSNYLQTC